MKVLLKQDVENLGLAGEIRSVADGFGRNYLLPRGFAVRATEASLKQAEAWRERASARRAQLQAEYEALSAKITGATLEFIAKAGETGKLYGSVTTADIADKLNETLGTELDRRLFNGGPLRNLGEHDIEVRLSSAVQPTFKVVIVSEAAIAAAAAAAAAPVVEETPEAAEEATEEAAA